MATYVRNGFRTDVNKGPMIYGDGMPIQPIYNTLSAPILDTKGSICEAFTPTAGSKNIKLTLNPRPAEDTALFYQSVNGQNMSVLDCQRCITFTLSATTTQECIALITGYDDRFVMVQEQLKIPLSTSGVVVSNKAYLYIQSIILNQGPWGDPTGKTLSVEASNRFFGVSFYLSYPLDTVMTVSSPQAESITNIGDQKGVTIGTANNFYKKIPNATALQSGNTVTVTGSGSSTVYAITISLEDAHGILALGGPEIDSSDYVISGAFYTYAADSFVNSLLQSRNPKVQNQASKAITGTLGEVNNPNSWDATDQTDMKWATTALSPFDLTGCQFPGDRDAFNAIFNNPSLPEGSRRFMGTALTLPDAP
jgi:hypothetical protein